MRQLFLNNVLFQKIFKVWLLGPPSSLEFPVTLCGGGVDILWKYTISKSYLSVALLALMVFLMPILQKNKVWIGHNILYGVPRYIKS